jgi:hypothetical protein
VAKEFDSWICESLDVARLRKLIYYFSAGFPSLQACDPE